MTDKLGGSGQCPPTVLTKFEHFISGSCMRKNSHVNKLKGTSSKDVVGWNINMGITSYYYGLCKNLGGPYDFWVGSGEGNEISTTLHDCGHAILSVGNCYNDPNYLVEVWIDGLLLGKVPFGNSKTFVFAFNEGTVLKINSGGAILRFNNFEVTDCICENPTLTGGHPDGHTERLPGIYPSNPSGGHPDGHTEHLPGIYPGNRSGGHPDGHTEHLPGIYPGNPSGGHPDGHTEHLPGIYPGNPSGGHTDRLPGIIPTPSTTGENFFY